MTGTTDYRTTSSCNDKKDSGLTAVLIAVTPTNGEPHLVHDCGDDAVGEDVGEWLLLLFLFHPEKPKPLQINAT